MKFGLHIHIFTKYIKCNTFFKARAIVFQGDYVLIVTNY